MQKVKAIIICVGNNQTAQDQQQVFYVHTTLTNCATRITNKQNLPAGRWQWWRPTSQSPTTNRSAPYQAPASCRISSAGNIPGAVCSSWRTQAGRRWSCWPECRTPRIRMRMLIKMAGKKEDRIEGTILCANLHYTQNYPTDKNSAKNCTSMRRSCLSSSIMISMNT